MKEPKKANESASEPKFTAATDKYVEQLNQLHLQEGQLWIEQGKLVHEFVLLAKKKAPNSNAYRLLAEHPDSILEASMLRYYEKSFLFWTEMGGEKGAPNVSVSHVIQVLDSTLDPWEKKRLLREVVEEKLTTRQLKQRARQLQGKGKDPLPDKSWEKTLVQLVAATKRTYELASWLTNIRAEKTIPDDLRECLKTLVHYLLFQDMVHWAEFEEMRPRQTDDEPKEGQS